MPLKGRPELLAELTPNLPFQDSADCDAMAAILGGKFVDRFPRLVGGGDLADLLIREP